jgi:hypothetical protein
MGKQENIVLVKGTFSPGEAQELLLALLNSKINFHNTKDFSSRERFGRPDAHSQERLKHLKSARQQVIAKFSNLGEKGNDIKSVTLNSVIEIGFE